MRTQRTIGIILATCLLAGLTTVVGLIAWLGIGPALGLVAVAIAAYLFALGPWQRRWGATHDEVHRVLPGDDLLRADAPSTTRAITIDAPPEHVFPWLLQIGFGRGGWYSYDWIDNDGLPSVERIEPGMRFEVGDRVEMMPGFGPVVRAIEPDRHIVSGGDSDSWCLFVEPAGEGRTRLISRWKQDWPRTPATYVWIAIADPGAFIMERKMLLRIRELAERSAATARASR